MAWSDRTRVVQKPGTRIFSDGLSSYTPPEGGAPTQFRGIFRRAHETVDLELGEVAVSSETPTVWVRVEDLPAGEPRERATVTIANDGATYTVEEIQKDGEGMALLILQEQLPAT